jgi:hypothetical protein
MDMADQAGRGGVPGNGQLTSALPDEARLNLVGGWTNVIMAGIDVGLETKAIQALARGTSRLGVSGVRIGRDGWQRILKAKQQGGKHLAQVLDDLKLPKAVMNEIWMRLRLWRWLEVSEGFHDESWNLISPCK